MTIDNNYRYAFYDSTGVFYGEPLGEQNLTIEHTAPKDSLLGYNISLVGKIKFVAEDFNRFYESLTNDNICNDIPMAVQKRSGGNWLDVITGILSLFDGDWDLDNCILEIQPQKRTVEDIIESSAEYNLFSFIPISQRVTVNTVPEGEPPEVVINKAEEYEHEETATDTPPVLGNGYQLYKTIKMTDYGEPIFYLGDYIGCERDDNPTITYDFYYVRIIGWVLVGASLPFGWTEEGTVDGGYRKVYRQASLSEDPTTRRYDQNRNCRQFEIEEYDILPTVDTGSGTIDIDIDNGLRLSSILSVLCSQINLTPVSDFFNINSADPANATTNYVTGEASTTANIVLFQKSDVKRPGAENNATIFNMSLKDLLEWLVTMFNARYDINDDDQLIIEHVSRKGSEGMLDLTTSQYSRWVKNRFKFKNNEIPPKETFRFMESRPEVYGLNDFNGTPIEYHLRCFSTNNDDKTHSVDNLTTDINWVMDTDNAEKVSDDGFVMVACSVNGSGEYHVIRKPPILSINRELNNVLGWSYLHIDFWRHYRYMNKGMMNDQETYFLSSVNSKVGEKFSIPYCDIENFNPNVAVKTVIGIGEIEKAVFDLGSNMLQLEVSYPGPAEEPPPVEPVEVFAKLEFIPSPNDPPPAGFFVLYGTLQLSLFEDEAGTIPYVTNDDFVVRYNTHTEGYNYTDSTVISYSTEVDHVCVAGRLATGVDAWYVVQHSKTMNAGDLIESIKSHSILPSENYTIIP